MTVWPTPRLGGLVEVLSGFAFDSAKFADSGSLPIVRIRDVSRGSSNTRFTGAFDERFLVADGDLLIGMDGEFNRAIWRGGRALLNQRVCRVKAKPAFLDQRYLFHFLPNALKAIEDVTPFVTVKHLSVKQLSEILIPLPALAEQRRIAEILDRAETLRAQRRQALAQLDALAESIFLDMFGDPVRNEKGWPSASVGDLGDVQGGLQLSPTRSHLPLSIPYLRVANVFRDLLDLAEIKTFRASANELARTRLEIDDLLVVEGHGNAGEIGRCARWDGSIADCSHQNHLIRVRVNRKLIDPVFLSRFLNSAGGRRGLLSASNTTSGLNTISVGKVKACRVLLPPLTVQRSFARAMAEVHRVRLCHQASRDGMEALFSSIQFRAFSGELTGAELMRELSVG